MTEEFVSEAGSEKLGLFGVGNILYIFKNIKNKKGYVIIIVTSAEGKCEIKSFWKKNHWLKHSRQTRHLHTLWERVASTSVQAFGLCQTSFTESISLS